MANDWKLEDLLKDPRATMRQIVDGKTTSAFYPNKRTAMEKNLYLPGPKDSSNDYIGSIICRDISIDSHKSVQAILSISTYGHQICEEDDDDTKRKVLNLLLPSFEKRIKLELALLYIKEVMSS